MIVEDDLTIAGIAREILQGVGYTVELAGNGSHALEQWEKLARSDQKIDLLVTDIRMPFMDGLELATQIRRRSPETKILLVSGMRSPIPRNIPADDILFKPYTPKQLIETTQRLLAPS
jgi:CheY-like chemotaxis protein